MTDADRPSCPSLGDLMCARDSVLPASEGRWLLKHLRSCTRCREDLDELEALIAGSEPCLDDVLAAAVINPSPDRLDLDNIARGKGSALSRQRLALVLLTCCCALVLADVLSRTTVHADRLLERAATTERSRPSGTRERVRVRMLPIGQGAARLPDDVRELSDGMSGKPWLDEDTARLMEANHFDWRRPLNIGSFRRWREGLSRKQDEVSILGRRVALRTTTPDGALRMAEIAVNRDTFKVVRETLVFEGIGRVEIEMLSEDGETTTSSRAPQASPLSTEEGMARVSDTQLLAELAARMILFDEGLDSHNQVTVAPHQDGVLVEGHVWPDARRQRVDARLSGLAHVRTKLRAEPGASGRTTTHGPSNGGLVNWATQMFDRDNPERHEFVPRLQAAAHALVGRLVVLHTLQRRFPLALRKRLTPVLRHDVSMLMEQQAKALAVDISDVEVRLGVLTSLPFCRASSGAWKRSIRAEMALKHAQTLEAQVTRLIERADLPPERPWTGELVEIRETFAALVDAAWGTCPWSEQVLWLAPSGNGQPSVRP